VTLDNAFPSGTTPPTQLSTATQWESFFVAGLGGATGVSQGVGNLFAGSLNSGTRSAVVATGAAMIRGFYVNGGSSVSTAIPAASGQNRIDRLVLRLDRTASAAGNWILPVVITGTAGSNPQPPAPAVSTTGSYDLPICHWTSGSNGSLSAFVEDRVFMGQQTLAFESTSRPPASVIGIGIETDTGRILRSDGSAWNVVIDDSGWVNVPLLGHWEVGGFTPQVRRIGNVCYFRGSVVRTADALPVNNTDNNVGAMPAGFIPAATHNWTTLTSATVAIRFQLQPGSGAVAVVDQGATVGIGSAVYLDTTYMVG
jgi:hypothetical protein